MHRLDPIPLQLEGSKKLLCQRGLDKLDGGTLEEGSYRFEVPIMDNGRLVGTRAASELRGGIEVTPKRG